MTIILNPDELYIPKQYSGFAYFGPSFDEDSEKEMKVDLDSIDKNIKLDEIDRTISLEQNIILDFYKACYMQPYSRMLLVNNKGRDTTFFTKLKEKLRFKYHYGEEFDMILDENKMIHMKIPHSVEITSFEFNQLEE